MCRLAAYLGPDIRFDEFLLEPTHNLARQALLSETTPAAYPDGFGLGWYAADGVPSVYLHSLPLWSDLNLPHLAHSIYARLMLAIVQGAAAPFSSPTHSQPCHDNRLLFLHQGFVEDFNRLRHTLRDFLEPPIEMAMVGNTPAEHSFALLRHLLNDDPELTIEQALAALFDLLAGWLGDRPHLLNLIVADSDSLYVVRHAVGTACPAIYYSVDDDAFPDGQLVASEPLTASEFWQPLPEHHLLVLNTRKPPELFAL